MRQDSSHPEEQVEDEEDEFVGVAALARRTTV
jgi:hypothetical protein